MNGIRVKNKENLEKSQKKKMKTTTKGGIEKQRKGIRQKVIW